jgi:ATP-dependent helicase/DNAse subunit B
LHHLGDQLFTLSRKDPIPNDGALTLQEAPDHAAEVRTALRWLKQQIVWGGVSPDQVALLARDIGPYRPFISQIATEFGLPIRLIDGQALAHSPAITSLMTLLRLYLPVGGDNQPGLARRPLIATWRSPYFRWENGETTITPAAGDTLDLLARQQRVMGGLVQWQAAFTAAAVISENDSHGDEEAGGGGRLTRTAVSRLLAQFNMFLTLTQPPDTPTMRGFVQWLETLIGPDPEATGEALVPTGSLQVVVQARANATTATADVAALRTLKDILRGLVWAEEAVGQSRPVDFTTFFNELSGAIAAAHVVLPARPDQPEIVVANATQVRGLSFAAVAIMGLSEGSFPATISEDPFLRDTDRDALRQQFGFPLARSTQSAEREFFYEAVTRARQKLLLTRPVLADNGAEWVASPFWEAVRQVVAVAPEIIPSQAVVPLAETASPAEWWETLAAQSGDPSQVEDLDVWHHIQAAARIWQVRQAGETAVTNGNLSALTPDLTTRYGPDHIWSASRLESYQTCGFFFFVKSVLALAPRPEPAEGLDVAQLGSLYHQLFEAVTTAGLPDPSTEAAVRHQVTTLATPILDAAPEQQGFRETGWWAQTRQEILDNVTRSVMALNDGSYTFLQAEASFGFQGDPLVIEDGDDALRLHGFIDRIDRRPDGQIRLIDYKLGGKYGYPAKAFAQGKKLQLPLYALAAQETLGLGEVADGFYWHFQQAEASSFQLEKADGGVAGALETAVTHAWDAVHRIRQGQFSPQPPAEGCPSYCPAAAFCWQYAPKSW